MHREIPLPLIKTNQAAIVVFVLASFAFNQSWPIYIIFLIQLIALLLGPKANPFILIAKPLFGRKRLGESETQALELARFNQTIAVSLLGAASIAHLLSWNWLAYAAAGMVALAATAAVLGYCIGCTIYYQYKKWKTLRARTKPNHA